MKAQAYLDAIKLKLATSYYPGLPNFPHHVHIEEENTVEPGQPMGIAAFIDGLERALGGTV